MRRERTFEGVATAQERWPDVARRPAIAPARCAAIALFLLGAAACSAPPTTPAVPSSSTSAPISSAPSKTDVRSRLQGTWHLTTFQSLGTIPDEAAPILGRLQGAVQLRFEGDVVTTSIPGTSDEEQCSFEIADENGPSFTLITGLGMFRRAQARFVSDDVWEATENGPMWPGTTRFARVKR